MKKRIDSVHETLGIEINSLLDRYNKGIDRILKLKKALIEIANNGQEFEDASGSYVVDSNPIEVAQKALEIDKDRDKP